MSWSRNPEPRQRSVAAGGHVAGECSPDTAERTELHARVQDLEWRDRWNTARIERLSKKLIHAERAAIDLSEQLERVRAERDILLRGLLKASLEARS